MSKRKWQTRMHVMSAKHECQTGAHVLKHTLLASQQTSSVSVRQRQNENRANPRDGERVDVQ